jgi:hypothetical protein
MAPQSSDGAKPGGRIYVEDATGRRPFMRGILIHSLMAQGVAYEDAYRAAKVVRERVLPKGLSPRNSGPRRPRRRARGCPTVSS